MFNLCGFGAFYTKGRWEPLIGFVLISVSCFNRAQIKSPAELVRGHYSGNGAIGILGLTYKPDMDVIEEAFGLLLAQELLAANIPVVVFDPSADAARALGKNNTVRCAASAQECIAQSDVVVLATPWQEFS